MDQNHETLNLFEHDKVLWCGDLNYRLNSENFEEIIEMIQNNKLFELRKLDQLRLERDAGNVFGDFEEGKINFQPTYKFKVGTHEYDDEKKRTPSWCDRILYRGEQISQVFYTSVGSVTISDHKPVCSLLKIKIKRIDPENKRLVVKLVYEYLQSLKDNFVPRMKLASPEVLFS